MRYLWILLFFVSCERPAWADDADQGYQDGYRDEAQNAPVNSSFAYHSAFDEGQDDAEREQAQLEQQARDNQEKLDEQWRRAMDSNH
jgi:hypothetical protein